MRSEVRVHVQLADPCGNVKQKAEPAHPVEELHFTDFATLRWKSTDRCKYLAEKAEDPRVNLGRGPLKTRVTFANVEGADNDGTAKGDTSNDTENLELCIA